MDKNSTSLSTNPPSSNLQQPQTTDNPAQVFARTAERTKEKIQQDPTLAKTFADTPQLQNEVVEIEQELLNEIVARLNQDKMSPEEAQNLAKNFLAVLPIHDQRDLLEKLKKLSQTNYAVSNIYLHYAKPYEENERQRKLELMSKHIQEGNIEHALAVAKGGSLNG